MPINRENCLLHEATTEQLHFFTEPFMVIRDFDYLKEVYFWVNSDYKEQFYPISDNMVLVHNAQPVEDMHLYKSVSSKDHPDAFQATAWLNATDKATANDQTIRDDYNWGKFGSNFVIEIYY